MIGSFMSLAPSHSRWLLCLWHCDVRLFLNRICIKIYQNGENYPRSHRNGSINQPDYRTQVRILQDFHVLVKFIWCLIKSPTAKTVLIKLVHHFILPNRKYGKYVKLLNMWNHPSVLEPPRPSNNQWHMFLCWKRPNFIKYQSR